MIITEKALLPCLWNQHYSPLWNLWNQHYKINVAVDLPGVGSSKSIITAITRVARRRLGKGKVALLGALGDDAEAAQYRQAGQDNEDGEEDDQDDQDDQDDDQDEEDDDAQGSSYLRGFARPTCGFRWQPDWTLLVIGTTHFLNAGSEI